MKVYFIGAGPGAADLITVRGAEILRRHCTWRHSHRLQRAGCVTWGSFLDHTGLRGSGCGWYPD